jgi:isopentenyl diphosphate isomerase/L-lactate dehydrogenase-like FMN-dependent dehydrogenase
MTNFNMNTQILGTKLNLPFGVAPVAMQKLIHPHGEILAAREAYLQNTAYGLSMLATSRPS